MCIAFAVYYKYQIKRRCVISVARMEEMRNLRKILVGNPKGRSLEDLGICHRVI
jgi:hypothetical protein